MRGRPKARDAGLIVEQLRDELLIYDVDSDEAHCLSPVAAHVWKQCDGRQNVASIASALPGGADDDDSKQVVRQAVDELAARGLLAVDHSGDGQAGGLSRRDVLVRAGGIGATAAFATPLIKSIIAPTPADAITTCCGGRTCSNSGDCNTCPTGCRSCQAGFCR